MDRSRCFGLVLSPEAIASDWVKFEHQYFLSKRDREAVVLIQRRPCSLPEALHDLPILDFTDTEDYEDNLKLLISKLCPAGKNTLSEVESTIDAAFEGIEMSDTFGGLDPGPTHERDAFFHALTLYDIDDAASEGLAVAAFNRAAEHLLRVSALGSNCDYNFKMLLGECLAVALYHSGSYRQVSQRFLDIAETQSENPVLLFVVVRAYSKLSEIDLRFVDTSVLMHMISQLDAKQQIGNEEKSIEILLGRTVGKIRETPVGELLIKTLSEGGRTSRIVTAVAISFNYDQSPPVFYLSELDQLYESHVQQQAVTNKPPSKKLLSLLFDLDLDQDKSVQHALDLAKWDLQRAFPDIDFPYPYFWSGLHQDVTVTNQHNSPFMGAIIKVTLRNMVDLADNLDVSNVACLTELRIVDALFNNCGALLILEQDPDSHQCRRLRSRGVPYGMLSQEMMSKLSNGDIIVVDQQHVSLWKKTE